jgi:cytochrome c553/cytochrome c5
MRLLRAIILLVALAAAGGLAAMRLLLSPRRMLAAATVAEEHRARAGGGGIKPRLFKVAALLAVLGAAGFLVAASGIVPIKASSGHWAITAWFLHFTMRRSIATHTLGLKAPSLDDPSLVLQGAGHYETGCRPCHGGPDLQHPRIPQQMTPHPPYLSPRVSEWDPDELFYIVKHGVKFTGMPAWPAQQRDDEVWAMVAFLRTLPELDVEEYRRLVHGEAAPNSSVAPIHGLLPPEKVPRAVNESCGRCHGVDGRGRGEGAFPRLAGQRPAYLYAALQAFARGERYSGMMEPIAVGLSLEEMRELARYYGSRQGPSPSPTPPETTLAIARGKAIANQGIPSQRVPSCVDCHGPGTIRRNPIYPMLAGQYANYLILQLELFKKGHRGGSPYAHLMRPIAARLNPEQMRDVALYYASLTSTLDPLAQ